MNTGHYLAFVAVSIGIILMPGPNVLLIVATAVSDGLGAALKTVAGTSSAMLLQLGIAALGATLLAQMLAEAFVVLKWLGVIYLAWLGAQHLLAIRRQGRRPAPDVAARTNFRRGFLVSLTNPKTIIFFSAFLPQFVVPEHPVAGQLALLSLTFLALATLFDSCYAAAANSLSRLVRHPSVDAWRHGISGVLYLGAGLGVALLRRQ